MEEVGLLAVKMTEEEAGVLFQLPMDGASGRSGKMVWQCSMKVSARTRWRVVSVTMALGVRGREGLYSHITFGGQSSNKNGPKG